MNTRILYPTLIALFLFGSGALCGAKEVADKDDAPEPVSTLEGVLKIHPKFLFKYFITGFGDGQACALLGDDKLKDIRVGSLVRVKGRLGTRLHEGGTDRNQSPFPRMLYIVMEVESVEVLREPEEPRDEPPGGRRTIREEATSIRFWCPMTFDPKRRKPPHNRILECAAGRGFGFARGWSVETSISLRVPNGVRPKAAETTALQNSRMLSFSCPKFSCPSS